MRDDGASKLRLYRVLFVGTVIYAPMLCHTATRTSYVSRHPRPPPGEVDNPSNVDEPHIAQWPAIVDKLSTLSENEFPPSDSLLQALLFAKCRHDADAMGRLAASLICQWARGARQRYAIRPRELAIIRVVQDPAARKFPHSTHVVRRNWNEMPFHISAPGNTFNRLLFCTALHARTLVLYAPIEQPYVG